MIFLQDALSTDIYTDVDWSDEYLASMYYPIDNGFIIGTARNMDVPLSLNIHETRPELDHHAWDHIVECSIGLPSGILSISGTTDYIKDFNKINLSPGIYNILICYAGLGTISYDGLDGNDAYTVHAWKGDGHLPGRVIKKWELPG